MAEQRASELARALDERVAESGKAIAELRAEMSANLASGMTTIEIREEAKEYLERERVYVNSQEMTRKSEEEKKALIARYETTNANLTQTIRRYK